MDDRKARYDRRQGARQRRSRESRTARTRQLWRNVLIGFGGLAAVVVVVGVVVFLASNTKELPPTGFTANHIESFPPQQINEVPIPRNIQEHVMERGGRNHSIGNMLIHYNCRDYQCEPDTIEKLTDIVRDYPDNVYLAPYPGMDAKIAMAAPNRLTTLDDFDEERVRKFIEDNLDR